jgi:hypothetical protein
MMTEKDLDFETNDDGEMLDDDGDRCYCEATTCEAPATRRVVTSENKPHDSTRNYCEQCAEVYYVGVQHGRFHEAALYGARPGRDSSQDPPKARFKKAVKLALKILDGFQEAGSLYDDYKQAEHFTDSQFEGMLDALREIVGQKSRR